MELFCKMKLSPFDIFKTIASLKYLKIVNKKKTIKLKLNTQEERNGSTFLQNDLNILIIIRNREKNSTTITPFY